MNKSYRSIGLWKHLNWLKEILGEERSETPLSDYFTGDVYSGTAPPVCLCNLFHM